MAPGTSSKMWTLHSCVECLRDCPFTVGITQFFLTCTFYSICAHHMDFHLVASGSSPRSNWLLWRALNAKSILAWSGVRCIWHNVHPRFCKIQYIILQEKNEIGEYFKSFFACVYVCVLWGGTDETWKHQFLALWLFGIYLQIGGGGGRRTDPCLYRQS